MGSDIGGGIFALAFLFGIAWAVFFYSNGALLYLRHEFKENTGYTIVECRYMNAVGMEWPQKRFFSPFEANRFYCPRYKQIGVDLL